MSSIPSEKDLQRHFFTLLKLSEMGASNRSVKVSTEFLAEKMSVSQQTASRQIIGLERIGWIHRNITHEGTLVKITEQGNSQLKRVYCELATVLESRYPPSMTFEGILFSGLGEGAYYVAQDIYRKQFVEKLGFDPYPGTLNLKLVSEYDVKMRSELDTYPAAQISGFKNRDRSYGSVRCFPALINNKEKGAVVYAMRSHYDSSVIEVISPVYLRGRLKLRDGNKIKVELYPYRPVEKAKG